MRQNAALCGDGLRVKGFSGGEATIREGAPIMGNMVLLDPVFFPIMRGKRGFENMVRIRDKVSNQHLLLFLPFFSTLDVIQLYNVTCTTRNSSFLEFMPWVKNSLNFFSTVALFVILQVSTF